MTRAILAAVLLLTLAAFVVVGSISAVPQTPPVGKIPPPWKRLTITGSIIVRENGNAWQGGTKKLYMFGADSVGHDLAFFRIEDYREAERCIGLIVKVDGIEAQRGDERWIVCEKLTP